MSFWSKLKRFGRQLLTIVPIAVTVASAVTAITPDPTDDIVVAAIHRALDVMALNVGENKHSAQ